MNKNRIAVTLILVLLSVPSMAQQRNHTMISLDSCRAWALANQAKMKKALLDKDAAQETRMAALTKYFPSLSATAGVFQSQDYLINVNTGDIRNSGAQLEVNGTVRGQDVGNNPLVEQVIDYLNVDVTASLKMLDHGAFANLLVTQPIFAGGRIIAGNKLAKLGVEAAELQTYMTRDEVLLTVEERFWMLHSLYAKRTALEQALQMIDTLRRDAEAGTDAGVVGRNDLLKVKLKQNEMLAAKTQLDNGIRLATKALAQYVGRMELADVELVLVEPEEQPISMSSMPADAAANYESRLLELAERAEALKLKMTIGESLPQVAVGCTYGANNLLGSNFGGNGMVFATANVPISAWWENSHNARKQRISLQRAAIDREDLTQQLALQNQQVSDALYEAVELLAIRRQAVADAESNLAEVANYYEAGLCSISELLEAQTLLQQSRADLADQQVEVHLKRLRYGQIFGGSDK